MRAINLLMCRALGLPLLAMALSGCGGGGGGGNSELDPTPINRAPTVSVVNPASNPCSLDVNSIQSMDITIRAQDPDGDRLSCVWTWDAGSINPREQSVEAGQESTVRFTPPNHDGLCTVTVTVSDKETSVSKNVKVNVTGHIKPPDDDSTFRILDIQVSPADVQPSSNVTLTASVENPGNKTLTYAWTCKDGKISGTGKTANWTAPKDAGVYAIYLSVSNGDKTISSSKSITVAGPVGGLQGRYYKTFRDREVVTFGELRMTRIDPQVNFAWQKLSPDPSKMPADGWGARWTGFVKCEAPGDYVFRVFVDDGARMRLKDDSGQWVAVIPNNAGNWSDHAEGAWLPSPAIPVSLQGGKWYPIELDYFEGGGDAFIRLYWSVNGGSETIVPQEMLRPPS